MATLILEAEEKITLAKGCLETGAFSDGIYHAYSAQVHAAKALLLQKSVQCNTQHGILNDFDKHFTESGIYKSASSFKEEVMRMNNHEPTASFADEYIKQAISFTLEAAAIRESMIAAEG